MYTTVTLNCWNTMYWDVRRPILVDFVKQFKPSVLCCQEVRPAVIEAIQEGASGSYQYVDPSRDSFEGWQQEGNIFWDPFVFSYIECGAIDAEMCEPLRRLFFVSSVPSIMEKKSSSPTFTSRGKDRSTERTVRILARSRFRKSSTKPCALGQKWVSHHSLWETSIAPSFPRS